MKGEDTEVDASQGEDAPSAPPPPPPTVRRKKALSLGLAAIIAASAVSWSAASRIRSPAEVAARTAPPELSLISVPVERRTLASEVVVRGTVRYGAPQLVSLPASGLKRNAGIVTTAAEKGRELSEGSVAMTLSGRPVIVLQGAQPAYRDMGPGATGEDVRQLEAALARLGFSPGAVDGVYDRGTETAVAAWYRRAGWNPLGPSEEQRANLRAGESDWYAAQADLLAAQEALALAKRDLAAARKKAGTAAVPPVGPGATTTPPPPNSPGSAAQSREDQQRVAAQVNVQNRQRALDAAVEEERQAQARMDEARSRRPPPSNEEYAALSRDVRVAGEKVATARDDLTAAQEALAQLPPPADGQGATPADASQAARDNAQAARDAAVVIRDSNIEAVTAENDVEKATAAMEFAKRREALLAKRSLNGPGGPTFGVQVPSDEVLFFPTLPLRIDDVKLGIGQEVSGPVVTVTNSRLAVDSALTRNDAKLVRPGAAVVIKAADLGIETTGTVSEVAESPGTKGVDPQRFYMEVTPTEGVASLVGASVVQTITVESTDGDVLAVPVAALSVSADGATRLQIQDSSGKTRQVLVEPGLAAKGLVAVQPVRGALGAGDLVVVGRGGPGSETKGGGAKPAKKSGGSDAP